MTCCVNLSQFIGKKVNDYALCPVVIKEASPFVTGKGYEMGMTRIVNDLSLSRHPIFRHLRRASCASRPDMNPGHPPNCL